MDRWRLRMFGAALLLCMGGAGWVAWWTLRPPQGSTALPILGEVGTFSLVSHQRVRFGSVDLAGSPWVANVIYTRCAGPCPMMTGRMAALERDLPAAFKFVTVTADPRHDVPSVLRRYIAAHGLRTARWTFLTGSAAAVRSLLRDRFRLPAGDPRADHGRIVVPHTEKIVLVDGGGHILGYYESGDPGELARLRADARRVTGF